ncbi:MAG: TGS domain-containing protein [Actinobacteria bacterium]|nr:TGS domain-containing protein [Actinomycetota bacterium]
MARRMPTNVSPEYKRAEAEFRSARTAEDRLAAMREMLRTLPKHKGTEHLQADIRTRIKELTDELAGPRKGGARTGPAHVVHPDGAGQVALVGPPNSGKSALHHRLTGSHAAVGPFPFTTQVPQPGMLPHLDIGIQLVDLPPVASEHPVPWLGNALQPADAALLVVDLGDPGCVDQLLELHDLLAERRVFLTGDWSSLAIEAPGVDEDDDPFAIHIPTLLVAAKADLVDHYDDELAAFRELTGRSYPSVTVSAETGAGLDAIGAFLFEHLGVVRVYTKIPGQPPDRSRPFTVRRGQTVEDVAVLIHKDLLATLRWARLWRGDIEGLQVGKNHPVEDGDVLEIHTH